MGVGQVVICHEAGDLGVSNVVAVHGGEEVIQSGKGQDDGVDLPQDAFVNGLLVPWFRFGGRTSSWIPPLASAGQRVFQSGGRSPFWRLGLVGRINLN